MNHLYNLDCLKILKIIQEQSIDFILTDLPYGTTQNKWDSEIDLNELWSQYKKILKPNSTVALFAQTPFDKVLGVSKIDWLKYEFIWEKSYGTGFLNANRAPLKSHENILIFQNGTNVYFPQMESGEKSYTCKKGRNSLSYGKIKDEHFKTINKGTRYPKSILRFNHDKVKYHPTQKPVKLCEYLIKTYSKEGDVVLDSCMGSGTTCIAAMNLKRDFIGFELDKEIFEIASKRIKEHESGSLNKWF